MGLVTAAGLTIAAGSIAYLVALLIALPYMPRWITWALAIGFSLALIIWT